MPRKVANSNLIRPGDTSMWTAAYLPSSQNENPSKDGFATEDEAWEYVFSQMCTGCQAERTASLADPLNEEISAWPACSCEWLVLLTEKLEKCDDLGDMFDAAGFVRVK